MVRRAAVAARIQPTAPVDTQALQQTEGCVAEQQNIKAKFGCDMNLSLKV
jgi:hypothetical protein